MSYESIEIARCEISDDITLAISTLDGFGYKEVLIDIIKNGKRVPLMAAGHDDDSDEAGEVYICVHNDDDHHGYELITRRYL